MLMRFRFDLFEITVFSFFNNLEEVKFYQRMRQHALRVVANVSSKHSCTLVTMTISVLMQRPTL